MILLYIKINRFNIWEFFLFMAFYFFIPKTIVFDTVFISAIFIRMTYQMLFQNFAQNLCFKKPPL